MFQKVYLITNYNLYIYFQKKIIERSLKLSNPVYSHVCISTLSDENKTSCNVHLQTLHPLKNNH